MYSLWVLYTKGTHALGACTSRGGWQPPPEQDSPALGSGSTKQGFCTPTLPPSPARDRLEVTVLHNPGADPSASGTFTLGCSVPSSHQHAAVPSQHPCCNIAWEKSNPTVSLLPLGILPLGGQRGCLPSLPGHSTLSEPNTRKVLISPATHRRREVSAPSDGSPLHPPPHRALLKA